MSIILKKGLPYNAEYTSADFPVLTADWSGNVSLYNVYPGTAIMSTVLTRVGNKFVLAYTIADIILLDAGLYSLVFTATNPVLGVTITTLGYATVVDMSVSGAGLCKLFMVVSKLNSTPAGRQTKSMTNSINGPVISNGWEGVVLSISNAVADVVAGVIVGTETVGTTTNAAGYAEIYVIKGLTVVVNCLAFGKSVTVNTTGFDSIDLSTYFV